LKIEISAANVQINFDETRHKMKVAILAGGLGTRLSEETTVKPKPMVEIGGIPMLVHIMNYYSAFGYKEFVVALGYKGEYIKDYFLNFYHHLSDLTIELGSGEVKVHPGGKGKDWTVHLLDTGINTQTGGRLKKMAEFIGNEPFFLTYGDGVSNVDLRKLLNFHQKEGKLVTLTAVRPPARFGQMEMDGSNITHFEEKPQIGEGWINGGFFVLEPQVVDYIAGDEIYWEREPLERLALDGQLNAYKHSGFWQSMDTLRDVNFLEGLWKKGNAPWLIQD
jgi:glucose-1-phosphate cytidylyltransferase